MGYAALIYVFLAIGCLTRNPAGPEKGLATSAGFRHWLRGRGNSGERRDGVVTEPFAMPYPACSRSLTAVRAEGILFLEGAGPRAQGDAS